jgi:uncharacterized protein involved in exopolysaccharide biosynthesis
MSYSSYTRHSEDNLIVLLRRLWADRRLCSFGMLIGGCLFLVVGLLLKPQFQVTMIVAPYEGVTEFNDFIDDMGTPAPRGAVMGAVGNKNFVRFSQSLRGAKVAGLLYRMDDVRSGVAADGTWRGTSKSITSSAEMVEYLQQHVVVEPVGATQSLKITFRHPDPVFGATFLRVLARANDQMIKEQDKAANVARIEWLKNALKKSFNPDHRQALARLLLSEERRAMVLSLNETYTYQMIEGAAASARASVPNFSLFIPLGFVLGLFCSALIVMFKEQRA